MQTCGLQVLLQYSFGCPFHVGLPQPGCEHACTPSLEDEDEVSSPAMDDPAEVEHAEARAIFSMPR